MNSERLTAFIGVGLIIVYQYTSYSYLLINLLYVLSPISTILLFSILSFLVFMIFWTYSFAVFRDPGYVENFEQLGDVKNEHIEISKQKSLKIKQKVKVYENDIFIYIFFIFIFFNLAQMLFNI